MAKVIEIGIASEGEAYRRGIEADVIKPTEDAEKALKEFAKQGDKAGDEIEQAMRTAQKESDRARNDIEKLGDEIVQAARKSRAMGDGMREGTGEAGDAIKEWGDEAKQNISETFSSFRGDAEDFVGIVQDTFGGVISGLGPIGMAAGVAGALGIGLMMGELEKAKEAEQEFREQVAELADVLIETGGEGSEAIQAIADRLRGFATETDSSSLSMEKIRAQAKKAGIDFEELARAYAGAGGDLGEYIKQVENVSTAHDEELSTIARTSRGYNAERSKQRTAIETVSTELRNLAKAQDEAAQAEQDWIATGGAAMEARAEQMSALQGELDEAIGSWSEYYDAETGATDPAKYLAAMQARMDATANFNTNVQQLAANTGLSFEAQQAIIDQGVEFAPMLASIMAGGSEMQAQYAAQIQAMLDGGQSIVDGTETSVTVTATADAQDAERQLSATAEERTAPVKAEATTAPAEKALDAAAAKPRTANITASVDLSSAESALNTFVNRRRVATVTVNAVDREGKLLP